MRATKSFNPVSKLSCVSMCVCVCRHINFIAIDFILLLYICGRVWREWKKKLYEISRPNLTPLSITLHCLYTLYFMHCLCMQYIATFSHAKQMFAHSFLYFDCEWWFVFFSILKFSTSICSSLLLSNSFHPSDDFIL